MTEVELRNKWTLAHFEEWKAEGTLDATISYEQYLDFRRWQEAETGRVIRELTEHYGEPPNEQPPELTEEDHNLLSEAWVEVARERQLQKAARAA